MRPAIAVALLSVFAAGCFDSRARDVDGGVVDSGPPVLDGGVEDGGHLDDGWDHEWIEDTLGWRVPFDCYAEVCSLFVRDPIDHPVSCPEDMSPIAVTTLGGRVITLLATCGRGGGWYGWPEVARPIVCGADRQCERLQHASEHRPRCIDGLCQVPEAPLDHTDVIALCIASVPRPPVALEYPLPPGAERAFDLADTFCPRDGDVCEIPPECAPR